MRRKPNPKIIIAAMVAASVFYVWFMLFGLPELTQYYDHKCKDALVARKWQDAIDACTNEIAFNSHIANGYVRRSVAYHALGKTDETQANALAGSEALRARLATANKRDIDILEHALPNDELPGNDKVITLVEDAEYVSASDPDKAEEDLREALKIDPHYPIIYRAWGDIYFHKQDWAKTEEKFQQWHAHDLESFKPYAALGVVKFLEKDYAASNDYMAKAEAIHPSSINFSTYRCSNFIELKKWHDAVDACSHALEMNDARRPGKSATRAKEHLDEHSNWYINAEDYFVFAHRAVAYRALGEKDKADKDLDAAIVAYQNGML